MFVIRFLLSIYGAAILVFTVAPLLVYTTIFFTPDESLDSAITDVLESYSREVPEFELAYGLYGFNAPAGADPIEYGRDYVSKILSERSVPEVNDPLLYSFNQNDFCYQNGLRDCSEEWTSILNEIPSLLEENAELLTRYELIQTYTTYFEPIESRLYRSLNPPPQNLANFLDSADLTILQIWYQAHDGQIERAWQLWEREHTYYREVFKNAHSTPAKERARQLIESYVRLRLALLNEGFGDAYELSMLQRLSDEERSSEHIVGYYISSFLEPLVEGKNRAEIRDHFRFYWTGRSTTGGILVNATDAIMNKVSIHPNTMANRSFNGLLLMLEKETLPAQEFEEWFESFSDENLFYNSRLLTGLVSDEPVFYMHGAELYTRYYYDLDRFIVLAQLAELIIEESQNQVTVESVLTEYASAFTDPLTGQAAFFDGNFLKFENSNREVIQTVLQVPLDRN